MSIFALIDENGFPTAFFDDRIHANMPKEAIPISELDWKAHVSGQTRRWDGSQWVSYTPPPPPPPPIEEVRANALGKILAYARDARARIAGTGDPAKLAEYADKAALAPQIIAGTAPADAVAAAREEALDLGLQDIPSGDTAEVQLARIWEQKAAQLRQARNIVNRMERQARAAVEAAADEAAIEQVLNDYKAQADQALTDLLVQMRGA